MAVSALKTIAKGLDDPSIATTATKAVTATGRSVDLSKGFKVRGLDGTLIPFRPDTPLEKAKEWTKNFYRKDFDFVLAKADEAKPDATPLSVVRDKKDPGNALQFYDYGNTYQIQTAKVGEAYKGKGIGAGMYRTLFEKAKSRGVTVTSDSRLSADSFAVWMRFKELGYPIKERPYKKIGDHYELADKDLMKTPEEQGGIFEYDPLAGDVPSLVKPQAGRTAEDMEGGSDALLSPQARLRQERRNPSTGKLMRGRIRPPKKAPLVGAPGGLQALPADEEVEE